jgi:hypothetical protein
VRILPQTDGENHMSVMERNLGPDDRVVRGITGGALLGVGLLAGRRHWWGIVADLVGALLLLSAYTGFCHVRKTLGVGCSRGCASEDTSAT